MKIIKILPEFGVAPQMTPEDISAAVAQGFKSIINNRPDGEASNQPEVAKIRAAAEAAGLQFRSIPFTSGKQTSQDIDAFARALKELPGPVLAYCRTGTRSSKIWAQTYAAEHSAQETIEVAAAAGLDMSADRARLEQAEDSR